MWWLGMAFLSAALLGFYDVAKKMAVNNNAVLPVLLLNTLFSTLIFIPVLVDPSSGPGEGVNLGRAHMLVAAKSALVLSSWITGYVGLKHLPITIVGPINATRPVMVLLGAMLIFGERLNAWQWAGVVLSVVSFILMSLSSKKEKIDFAHNRWIWCILVSAVLGACSGLYDRYLMKGLDAAFVQGWYNLYQLLMMGIVVAIMWFPKRSEGTAFHWSWAIPLVSIFVSAADWCYLHALRDPEAMISVVSLVRRGAVLISFACGALLFKEKNLRSKAFDLALILLGMVCIYIGSR